MKVYFISGLGANERAFQFLDLAWCEPVFVKWEAPLKDESLKDYALRLRTKIEEANPVIVGVSFGGMLATEMAKADKGVKAIIVSSNKTSGEFPAYLRMWKHLPVYKWVSPRLIKSTGYITQGVFGPQGKAQKQAFRLIQQESDPVFVRWAVHAILHWGNTVVPHNVVHIHGTEDRLLPIKFVEPDHVIKKGKHIMIMDKAAEISILLKKLIMANALATA